MRCDVIALRRHCVATSLRCDVRRCDVIALRRHCNATSLRCDVSALRRQTLRRDELRRDEPPRHATTAARDAAGTPALQKTL